MNKETSWLQNRIEEIGKEFDKKFGEVPKGTLIIETVDGRNTCFWCGHPTNPDKELKRVKSFLSQKLHSLVEEAVEGERERILEEVADAFQDWYSRAWQREDISEKGGVGKRDKFTEEFIGILQDQIAKAKEMGIISPHGAGSDCPIDMCPICEKIDNN